MKRIKKRKINLCEIKIERYYFYQFLEKNSNNIELWHDRYDINRRWLFIEWRKFIQLPQEFEILRKFYGLGDYLRILKPNNRKRILNYICSEKNQILNLYDFGKTQQKLIEKYPGHILQFGECEEDEWYCFLDEVLIKSPTKEMVKDILNYEFPRITNKEYHELINELSNLYKRNPFAIRDKELIYENYNYYDCDYEWCCFFKSCNGLDRLYHFMYFEFDYCKECINQFRKLNYMFCFDDYIDYYYDVNIDVVDEDDEYVTLSCWNHSKRNFSSAINSLRKIMDNNKIEIKIINKY